MDREKTVSEGKFNQIKVVRPTKSKYLGFTFLKYGGEWKVKPTNDKKEKLYHVIREYLKRGKATARPLAVTIKE